MVSGPSPASYMIRTTGTKPSFHVRKDVMRPRRGGRAGPVRRTTVSRVRRRARPSYRGAVVVHRPMSAVGMWSIPLPG